MVPRPNTQTVARGAEELVEDAEHATKRGVRRTLEGVKDAAVSAGSALRWGANKAECRWRMGVGAWVGREGVRRGTSWRDNGAGKSAWQGETIEGVEVQGRPVEWTSDGTVHLGWIGTLIWPRPFLVLRTQWSPSPHAAPAVHAPSCTLRSQDRQGGRQS